MQIEVKIDESVKETKVTILAGRMDDEVKALIGKLSEESMSENQCRMIAGFRGDEMRLLEQGDISRIQAYDGKVCALTEDGEYTLKHRLYELVDRLDKSRFVRISNSEIINLKKAKTFDLSLSGTICVAMQDTTVAYVSRRYVQKIKKTLGI